MFGGNGLGGLSAFSDAASLANKDVNLLPSSSPTAASMLDYGKLGQVGNELLYQQLLQQQQQPSAVALQLAQQQRAAALAAMMGGGMPGGVRPPSTSLGSTGDLNFDLLTGGQAGMGLGNFGEKRDARVKQRLARNRTTARIRRERKKHEAELLTKYVAALRLRLKELTTAVDNLPKEEQEEAFKIVKSFGEPRLACQFCSNTFEKQGTLDEHLKLNHAAELRAREQFITESRSFGLSTEGTLEGAANESGSGNQNVEDEAEGFRLSRLTSAERKKRRLERNAASARLCRQRKKLYIENLKCQLPGLRHRVKALEAALPKEKVLMIQKATPLPALMAEDPTDEISLMGRLSETEDLFARARMETSDKKSTESPNAADTAKQSETSSKRKLSEISDTSSTKLEPDNGLQKVPKTEKGVASEEERTVGAATDTKTTAGENKEKNVDKPEGTATDAKLDTASLLGKRENLLAVDIPRLSGWSKSSMSRQHSNNSSASSKHELSPAMYEQRLKQENLLNDVNLQQQIASQQKLLREQALFAAVGGSQVHNQELVGNELLLRQHGLLMEEQQKKLLERTALQQQQRLLEEAVLRQAGAAGLTQSEQNKLALEKLTKQYASSPLSSMATFGSSAQLGALSARQRAALLGLPVPPLRPEEAAAAVSKLYQHYPSST
uniref:C2H2-type domain-containing protein n=1 Tax=Mucochytrium quahogii TaxID=96639 RepID=A0A7S2WP47_9STRA|mmetsp:Transcript_6945/g.10993  ORF Transcript_6945/g.10993 Transcript_6945/m.10993 type:complete len:669 (+) Transcript_6945:451-2457(+)